MSLFPISASVLVPLTPIWTTGLNAKQVKSQAHLTTSSNSPQPGSLPPFGPSQHGRAGVFAVSDKSGLVILLLKTLQRPPLSYRMKFKSFGIQNEALCDLASAVVWS